MSRCRNAGEAMNYGAALRRALNSQTDEEVDALVASLPANLRDVANEVVAEFRRGRSKQPLAWKLCQSCDGSGTTRRPLLWDSTRDAPYHRTCARPGAQLGPLPAEPRSADPVRTPRARRVRTSTTSPSSEGNA